MSADPPPQPSEGLGRPPTDPRILRVRVVVAALVLFAVAFGLLVGALHGTAPDGDDPAGVQSAAVPAPTAPVAPPETGTATPRAGGSSAPDSGGDLAGRIARHFEAVTGDRLEVKRHPGMAILYLDSNLPYDVTSRYPFFSIEVSGRPIAQRLSTPSPERGPDGRYRTPDPAGSRITRQFGEASVSAYTKDGRVTQAQRVVELVLSTVGQPPAAVRRRLPDAWRSCRSLGRTPAGSGSGPCRDSTGLTTRISEPRRFVPVGDASVSAEAVRQADVIRDRLYGDIVAKGTFIGVELRVRNGGLERLSPRGISALRIGGQSFEEDRDAGSSWADTQHQDGYVDPGRTETVTIFYDVPHGLLPQAHRSAVVEFGIGGGRPTDPQFADELVRIRIRDR